MGAAAFAIALAFASSACGSRTQLAAPSPTTYTDPSNGSQWNWSTKPTWDPLDPKFAFYPGMIEVQLSAGVSIGEALKVSGLRGPAVSLYPTSSDFEQRAGLDRIYHISVPVGDERVTATRLQGSALFDYVGLAFKGEPAGD